jgi:membrane-associated protease RseP (regulator of RpoE activity)
LTEPASSPELQTAFYQALAGIFSIGEIVYDRDQPGLVRLQGHFVTDTAEAYPIVQQRFSTLGYTPLFREEGGRHVILAMPGQLPAEQPPNVRLAVILLLATVASCIVAGALGEWQPERPLLENLVTGLPFALTLMPILLAHELGHYFVARRLGIPVTLPYFIPLPISPLGTMGAFIQLKGLPQNRRHLLMLGLAGPLSGLILAIPVLIVGLTLSHIQPSPVGQEYMLEGNSLLYGLLKTLVFGYFVPNCGYGPVTFGELVRTALRGCPPGVGVDVFVHPIAFAGWAGLLVTGLNLIPAGTLDGGHIAYALLGKHARDLTWALIVGMVLLGFMWNGWWLWAGLIALIGRRPAVPLDDVTRLERWQLILAGALLVIFLLTFSPVPMSVIGP